MNDPYKTKLLSFYESHKRMPSYTEMMALFGYKSKNAVFRLVSKLIDAGIVAKDRMGKLIPTNTFTDIPLLGSVKAGFPSATDEALQDTLSIDSFLIKKRESTYLLEVDGDSMIDAHITSGDLVIAERTDKAKDGDIVIAQVDGEFTMKYFKKEGSNIWLEPANKAYAPIYPVYELTITAVIKAVIRKY